jgi:hexosaminidase
VTDAASMYDRMEAVSRTLEWTGIQHRANYGPMLDRLAGGRPAEPLAVLADACEALGLSGRHAGSNYTTETPLNRLVDAARPESEMVRALEQAAARGTAPDRARLRDQFRRWAGNDAPFQALAAGNALLAEAKPLSRDLAQLGATGLEILDYLESAKPAPKAWLAHQNRELARMSKPSAEINLAAVRPVKILLDQLAKRSR